MMRRLIALLCCASVLLACGTPDSSVTPTVQTTTGQLPYPTPSSVMASPTVIQTPAAPLPSPEETPNARVPSEQPEVVTPTPVFLTRAAPVWGTLQLTTVFTDDQARLGYHPFGWSPTRHHLLVSRDETLFVIDVERQKWIDIAPHTVLAAWAPAGDTIAYITYEPPVGLPRTYTLWQWSLSEGAQSLMEVPATRRLQWITDHEIALTTNENILRYNINPTGISQTIGFQAPASYIRTSPGFEGIVEPSASIYLAPDGIHGTVSDNNGMLSFFEGETIIGTTTVAETTGSIWSHDSEKVAMRTNPHQMSIFNNHGVLQHVFEGDGMMNLSPMGWSNDDTLLTYMFNGAGTSSYETLIMKIGDIGSIKVENLDLEEKSIDFVMWSFDEKYISYRTSIIIQGYPNTIDDIFIINRNEDK